MLSRPGEPAGNAEVWMEGSRVAGLQGCRAACVGRTYGLCGWREELLEGAFSAQALSTV